MANENGQTGGPAVVQNNALQTQDATVNAFRTKLQNFNALLNVNPPAEALDKTPDGKAQTVVISHVEMQLDTLFFGLWSTENFKWSTIANEVVGSLDLVVVHPVTEKEIRRTGAACVQIMVDKAPEDIKANPIEKNRWHLNPDNKKPNALDMTFPKLKAECLKNAAQSFGKIFGRDINRKISAEHKGLKTRGTAASKGAAATAAAEQMLHEKFYSNGTE